MKFIMDVEKNKYEQFVKNHPTKSHFLQSYAWGEFSKKSRNLTPHYLGLVDDNNNLVAATLLLQKKMPLGYSYFYAPRGFVLDFFDKKILTEFVNNIKKYIKDKKAIFLKIDPDIIINKYNYLNEKIEVKDTSKIFKNLTLLGFKHQGYTKNFETNQPRYTFRIDLTQPMEEIENKFSKTTHQRIKKATSLNTNVRIGNYDDINDFYHLMTLTENRKNFVSHDLEYYQELYKIYTKDNKIDLFIGSVDIDKIKNNYKNELEQFNKELNELENIADPSKSVNAKKKELNYKINSINKSLEEYKELNGNIVLNGHLIIEYGDKAWVLYAGNHNLLTSTYANYKTYYKHIKYCKENGIKTYDQFGTIGDLSKDNPRLGLHEFKKKFGGDYIEFIGEFDLVLNKFMYFVFTKLVPIYRSIIRRRAKKRI